MFQFLRLLMRLHFGRNNEKAVHDKTVDGFGELLGLA